MRSFLKVLLAAIFLLGNALQAGAAMHQHGDASVAAMGLIVQDSGGPVKDHSGPISLHEVDCRGDNPERSDRGMSDVCCPSFCSADSVEIQGAVFEAWVSRALYMVRSSTPLAIAPVNLDRPPKTLI